MRWCVCLLGCLLWSCGGAAGPRGADTAADARSERHARARANAADAGDKPSLEPSAGGAAANATAPSRSLPSGARFAELVALADRLLTAGQGDSTRGCLLATVDGAPRLEADLLSAFAPVPGPPPSFAAALNERGGRIAILSAWGRLGADAPKLVLAPFTTTSPMHDDAPIAAVLMHAEGISLRYDARDAEDADDGLAPREVVPRLLATLGPEAALYVTAEGGTPLQQLRAVLGELPAHSPVALAVLLPQGIELPASAPQSAQGRCPGGLAELPEDAAAGDLSTAALAEGLASFRAGARRCVEAGAGVGKVTLALRVAPDGTVGEACLLEGSPGNDRLPVCLSETARALRFPAPQPPGYVDLHLPLSLTPTELPPQHALCR